jgi:hypothetical protein
VYVYFHDHTWSQNAILLPDDGAAGDGFGSAVTVKGQGIDVDATAYVSSSGCVNPDSTTGVHPLLVLRLYIYSLYV